MVAVVPSDMSKFAQAVYRYGRWDLVGIHSLFAKFRLKHTLAPLAPKPESIHIQVDYRR